MLRQIGDLGSAMLLPGTGLGAESQGECPVLARFFASLAATVQAFPEPTCQSGRARDKPLPLAACASFTKRHVVYRC